MMRRDFGMQALLEFRGPDAVRFLNGQLTQDVRRVAGGTISLPSCVTDAKGKLQFRVMLTEAADGGLWISGLNEWAEALEARLTRYLIADEVDVADLTGKFSLTHFTGSVPPPEGVIAREANRLGVAGTDWWIPVGMAVEFPPDIPLMSDAEAEILRIENGVPAWGRELKEGMLPPEAGLDVTDISYQKGCYIGQEVISRIKSAGKVNRRLVRFSFAEDASISVGALEGGAGEITSISPSVVDGRRWALGFLKRGLGGEFSTTDCRDLWSI